MLFSRWKVMSGVIGISIGGLAALAGQSPKPVVPVASVSATPAVTPTLPPPAPNAVPPVSVELPPSLPVVPPSVPTVPSTPPSKLAVELPSLPVPESKPQETRLPSLPKPADVPLLPVGGTISSAGTSAPDATQPVTPPATILPPASAPTTPVKLTPPTTPTVPAMPPAPIAITSVEANNPPAIVGPPATKPAAAVQTTFRIVLRVGEGEPTFEVRHNDDLVMKVACDKVDIKSPEKGQGPSTVVATGKVRFVGFGAEGTCDSLSFLSGTGEVALAGNVNVKVRDKIGRVESELNADKMQYKLDSTALTGVLKP